MFARLGCFVSGGRPFDVFGQRVSTLAGLIYAAMDGIYAAGILDGEKVHEATFVLLTATPA